MYIIEEFRDKVNGFSLKYGFPIDKSTFCVSADSYEKAIDFSMNRLSRSIRVNLYHTAQLCPDEGAKGGLFCPNKIALVKGAKMYFTPF